MRERERECEREREREIKGESESERASERESGRLTHQEVHVDQSIELDCLVEVAGVLAEPEGELRAPAFDRKGERE